MGWKALTLFIEFQPLMNRWGEYLRSKGVVPDTWNHNKYCLPLPSTQKQNCSLARTGCLQWALWQLAPVPPLCHVTATVSVKCAYWVCCVWWRVPRIRTLVFYFRTWETRWEYRLAEPSLTVERLRAIDSAGRIFRRGTLNTSKLRVTFRAVSISGLIVWGLLYSV